MLVLDGEDYYQKEAAREKQKAQTYFLMGDEEKLKSFRNFSLQTIDNQLRRAINEYVKQKTGFDADVYVDFRQTVDLILRKNEITSHDEELAAEMIKSLHTDSGKSQEEIAVLNALLKKYRKLESESYRTETVTPMSATESSFQLPDYIRSPDEKFRFYISSSGSTYNESTILQLSLDRVGTTVFSANCAQSDIKAYWKSNDTIMVETNGPVYFTHQYHEVRNYNNVVKIKYIQN